MKYILIIILFMQLALSPIFASQLAMNAANSVTTTTEATNVGPIKYDSKCTTEMLMTEVIGPASVDSLQRALSKTKEESCDSLLILVNTPGGSLPSTRKIVQKILNSPVPILCLIYPSGAHAGSAGAIIMQACHVSGAMSATNIGAATPISSSGKDISKDLRKKLLNDTTSWLEGLTNLRHRNKKFGRDIIVDAKAVSAEEAVRLKALDVLVQSKEQFLLYAQGQKVKLTKDKSMIVKIGPESKFTPDIREKILKLVADPQTAYMIFMGSLALLYFEITHPGMIVPGVVGALGLVFAMISLDKLDVEWGGLLLIILGIGFLIAEAFVPSFGILGIGGTISFVVGSIFLFDEAKTGYSLPMSIILTSSLILGLFSMGIAYLAYSSRKVKKIGMYSDFMDEITQVDTVDPKNKKIGSVNVNGEIWRVKCAKPLALSDRVKVIGFKGLTLKVELLNKET